MTIHRDSEDLVEVRFTYPHEVSKARPPVALAQEGSIILDPQHHWSIRSWDVRGQIGSGSRTQKLEASLDRRSDSLPIPSEVKGYTEWLNSERRKRTISVNTKNDLAVPSKLPGDDEFTLSAFGLSEPFGLIAPKVPSPWYLWAIVAAIFVLIVGCAFGWLKRRSSREAISG
jgi:hypothetical protein